MPPNKVTFGAVTALAFICLFSSCGATQRRSAANAPATAAFSVFEIAPTADDALPGEVATVLDRSPQPTFSTADLRAARRILANDPGWLVPSTEGEICLVRLIYPLIAAVHGSRLPPTPSRRCTSEATAQAGDLIETQSLSISGTRSRMTRVVGVAPNGVVNVEIISSQGAITTVPVNRNAYEAVVADPTTLRIKIFHDHHSVTRSIHLTTFNAQNESPAPGGP